MIGLLIFPEPVLPNVVGLIFQDNAVWPEWFQSFIIGIKPLLSDAPHTRAAQNTHHLDSKILSEQLFTSMLQADPLLNLISKQRDETCWESDV